MLFLQMPLVEFGCQFRPLRDRFFFRIQKTVVSPLGGTRMQTSPDHHPRCLDSMHVDTIASIAGVGDLTAFASCVADRRHESAVTRDVDLGASLGVTGTPTILVDRLLLTALHPALLVAVLKEKLE
ncbi:MAG: hypothetical protein HUU26_06140 [Gemmatimonadaceae bacterium]|nr:hypothetical protein [Gemmatimonadaceae bacterium]